MLTPEDIERFKPEFEEIVWHLRVVLDPELNAGLSEDEVTGYAMRGIALMEDLVEKVSEKQDGRSIRDILGNVRPEERAGIIGAMAGVIASLSATGLGGFGIAAGGNRGGCCWFSGCHGSFGRCGARRGRCILPGIQDRRGCQGQQGMGDRQEKAWPILGFARRPDRR